ncbi:hypothetical protein LUZ60_004960 [Juncus effusus]|nr:hypothetical protein LUZ60_004960 [Juncus effusus]
MASTSLSLTANPAKICTGKNGTSVPSRTVNLVKGLKQDRKVVCMATSGILPEDVPDMGKRKLLNLLLLGALSLPTVGMLGPYTYFFVPPSSGGSGGGIPAKDKLGNDVFVADWVKTHGPNDRTLVQGLKGDPTYLVVENDKTLATKKKIIHQI